MIVSNRKSIPLLLSSLNHISRNCKNVQASINFYYNLLGFVQLRRPGALNFSGAWLYNYGIAIHLLYCEDENLRKDEIDVQADHISFQCEDIDMMEKLLREAGIKYERRVVEEEGIEVEQLFFHKHDGFMIEICTCDKLPHWVLLFAFLNYTPFLLTKLKGGGYLAFAMLALLSSICKQSLFCSLYNRESHHHLHRRILCNEGVKTPLFLATHRDVS